ncbi:hypothetical protein K435DRAFT_791053 [Dendrothele bispora CBS 962.96]|uniref:Uncharacterized protein n=1 Tax=Dendrothele bispora (strain CBS 962.96) TaxID=1314807 RepID=A0A4S8MP35_DENBC|nr:hypothetical protein K435DRAFT_791053 [Dendrothele bispora CBS 962.96]
MKKKNIPIEISKLLISVNLHTVNKPKKTSVSAITRRIRLYRSYQLEKDSNTPQQIMHEPAWPSSWHHSSNFFEQAVDTLILKVAIPALFLGVHGTLSITAIFFYVILDRTNYMINAGIVVWRVWILFPNNKFVKAVFIALLLGSLTGTVVDLRTEEILFIWTGPLLATNVTAALLTGYKAWCHGFILKKNLFTSRNPLTKAQKVLWLLVESGAISCILWVRI